MVATSIALVVLVGVARRWPRAWPAVAGLLLAGLVMLGSFVYPLLVEPLFNHFEPLPDGPLRTQILALADEEGVHVDDVLVADASRRTTTLNAYVSGLRLLATGRRLRQPGRRRRPTGGRSSVVAHELGHARHDDVLTGSLLGAAGALLGVGLLGLLRGRGSGRPAPGAAGAGAGRGRHAAGEPGPERHQPPDRDPGRRRLLRTTGDPEAFIALQKDLATTSLADPTPYAVSQFWFGSHPTALQRIALAERFQQGPERTNPLGHEAPRGTSGVWDQLQDRRSGPRRSSCSCLEHPDRAAAEREDCDGDDGGDTGDEEAVLHGRGPGSRRLRKRRPSPGRARSATRAQECSRLVDPS